MTTETKFDCVFCKEVFEDKADLLVHFRKHGDPKFNTNAKYKSRQQNEMPTNEKTSEENELVGCDVCEEVFPTISKAITHKHKAHPDHDAKYFCPFCGKLFTMKHLYNKHLQTNHESSEATDTNDFHCDCCEVTFHVPSAMLYHNKFFHRQDTELPAFGHSKKVKTYNQEPIQIYYCAFCGEEYNNKVNLHKHMGDDHGDENQSPTEILRCPLCEAIFYHLDAYEIHLTFHSTDDMYSEQNEMKEKVTEFSLETVSPIIEKVEEEVEDDEGINTASIDSFLQLVMGESADNDAPDKVKSKKHKKHKKSKKAAITLDEFLNMNKDVFGDGLNVQGIEEVPTQVVLKKVKGKKLPNKPEPKMVNADLAKLKKHGIVVKTKSGNHSLPNNFNKQGNKSNTISTPNEILSKLINQGNNQIKIVKKSVSQNVKKDITANLPTNTADKPIDSIINKDVTLDHKEEETENLTKTDTAPVGNEVDENGEISNNLQNDENQTKSDSNLLISSDVTKVVEDNSNITENDEKAISENNNPHIDSNTSPTTVEEKTTIVSNVNLPSSNQISIISHDVKPDFVLDNKAAKETCSSFDNDDNSSKKEIENNIANTTLNALKHLSHLITVKPVIQDKTTNVCSKNNDDQENKDLEIKNNEKESVATPLHTDQKNVVSKPLSGNITMKLAKESPLLTTFNSDAESDCDDFNDDDENKSNTELSKVDEPEALNKNIVEIRKLKIRNPPIIEKNTKNTDTKGGEEVKNEECHKKTSNLDILKRLTNVTAKPISATTGVSQISTTKQNKNNITHVQDVTPKNPVKGGIDDEIEIFNIDDSDSEGNESDAVNTTTENTPSKLPPTALRHLGKNIVVKSNQKNVFQNEQKIDNKNIKVESRMMNKQSPEIQKSINLQNKLKILGGNISVKSRNSSPNTYNPGLLKSFGEYDNDDDFDEAGDSGPESNVNKVKITEMFDNDNSDNDSESQNNAIVESPNASNSENEDINDDMEDDFSDFESQIKSNTLKKEELAVNSNKTTSFENFKNLNKDLTIKSLNTKKQDSEGDINLSNQKEITEDKPNVNKQLVTKQLKTNLSQTEPPVNKSSQLASTSTNQTSFNKKVSTSSNQVNTVKTVKRYQSQTVIEEITTTVTKTIRTVNQSTNEVVQNRCNTKPMIRPQKIINKLPGKELQGTAVRHASPPVGTKIRNATNIIRPSNPTIVRPSNQLVPARPVLNLPRPTGPGTPIVRKIVPPKCSPQKPAIGKLKISPHALNQATKRPSEETPGHFSCFKKSKDSLGNIPDMADYDDDNAMQFSSASQSRSDFSSVTKTVKGKGLITATQTRSEVSTNSQQQLSRLSNVSGLKIVKTNSKQATQLEEKYEINTAKQNTLDALEKLQKQGLLIKKPRIDEYNEQPNSFSESDDETNEK
ncbi:eisosome protein SEG2-like [Vanessa cardui]|uniref:eisosome protein SEG2-like n=1 Tax=Vanessa cardui TaxID=171605 RepID=UPI001F137AD3|nr:eisosome protein SEG2-like [Vanessa cardui]